jgi:hypothetical protein
MLFFRMLNSTHIGAQTMGETLQMLDMYRDEYDLVAYKKDRGNDIYPVLAGVTQSDWTQAKLMGGKKPDGTINIPTWRRIVEPHLLDLTALNVKQIVLIGGIILPRTVDFRYKVGPDDELTFLVDEWTKATARESFFSAIFPTLQIVLSAQKHKVPVHAIIFDPDEAGEDSSYEEDPSMAPKFFDFTGRIIFISNLPLSKLDPDGALRTRAYVINIDPTDDELFEHMGRILHDIKLEDGLSLTSKQREEVLEVVKTSKRKGDVSLRKLVRALNLAASGAPDWETLVRLYA